MYVWFFFVRLMILRLDLLLLLYVWVGMGGFLVGWMDDGGKWGGREVGRWGGR